MSTKAGTLEAGRGAGFGLREWLMAAIAAVAVAALVMSFLALRQETPLTTVAPPSTPAGALRRVRSRRTRTGVPRLNRRGTTGRRGIRPPSRDRPGPVPARGHHRPGQHGRRLPRPGPPARPSGGGQGHGPRAG